MHKRFITYFTWLGEELITVPNFPAWVCDVCGNRIYDERSLALLAMILNPQAGKPTRRLKTDLRTGPRKSSQPQPPLE
jgi:YgiT-type zinc finger domain-containing protein